jgi:hypothetical protein
MSSNTEINRIHILFASTLDQNNITNSYPLKVMPKNKGGFINSEHEVELR